MLWQFRLSVCLVCLSDTLVDCIKPAEHIKILLLSDRPMILESFVSVVMNEVIIDRYTCQKAASTVVYAVVLKWPQNDLLHLGAPRTTTETLVSMLGYSGSGVFQWTSGTGGRGIDIQFPRISFNELPSTWAWILKLQHLAD